VSKVWVGGGEVGKKKDNQPHTESRINYDAEVRKLPGAGGILKAVQG
jgi:hypothetical protein